MSMTPVEIWPIVAGSAFVVFGAGQITGKIIEKLKNNKHVKIELCDAYRAVEEERWKATKETLDKLSVWVDKQRD